MSAEHPLDRGLVLVKLGGSLVTDKRRPFAARSEVIERLAKEITAARRAGVRLVLGHGSGSFGHVAAKRHDLGKGLRRPDGRSGSLAGVSETQGAAARLHRLLFEALAEAGAAPYSLAPSSFLVAEEGRPVQLWPEALGMALDLGLLPVVFGDVVMDRSWGAAICSTETIFTALVEPLAAAGRPIGRALWMGETGGIYDATGATVPVIDEAAYERLLPQVGKAAGTDVTGGMAHRLEVTRALALRGVESVILDGTVAGRLEQALRGESVPGTLVVANQVR